MTCSTCHDVSNLSRKHRVLIVAEVLRWVVIVVPLFLAVWRYGELTGYDAVFPDSLHYWGIISAVLLGVSLVLYLPIKVTVMARFLYRSPVSWRPSILIYIGLSAVPVMVLAAIVARDQSYDQVDAKSVVILQVMVLGLTLTEWISKLREEHLTFDLVSAMSVDFFFAYDIIDFITMGTSEPEILQSNWVYVCLGFAFLAMFKYVPAQPVSITGGHGNRFMAAILVSMICCDIPFVIIRVWTMIIFNFRVSDLLHPLKNIALIVFGIMQLVIIRIHKEDPEAPKDIQMAIVPKVAPQNRRSRLLEGDSESRSRDASALWELVKQRVVRGAADGQGCEGDVTVATEGVGQCERQQNGKPCGV